MKCLAYEIQIELLQEQLVQLRNDKHSATDSSGSKANTIITTQDSTTTDGSSEADYPQQQMHQEWHFAVAAEMDSVTAAADNINRLVDHCFAIADQLSDTSANGSDITIELQDTTVAAGLETFDSAGDGSNANLITSYPNPPSPPLAEMPAAISLDITAVNDDSDSTTSSDIKTSPSTNNPTVESVLNSSGTPTQTATAAVFGGSLVPRAPSCDKALINHGSPPKPTAKLPRTACPWPRAKPANQPPKSAGRNRASLVDKLDSSVLAGIWTTWSRQSSSPIRQQQLPALQSW